MEERYSYERKEYANASDDFKIRDKERINAPYIATCTNEENAAVIVAALNKFIKH